MRDRGGAVVKLTHGEVYLDWDTESNVGATYRIPAITVKNKASKTKEYMGTVVHEAAHAALPDATEAQIVALENDITAVLWVRGFRLAKLTKPAKLAKRKKKT